MYKDGSKLYIPTSAPKSPNQVTTTQKVTVSPIYTAMKMVTFTVVKRFSGLGI